MASSDVATAANLRKLQPVAERQTWSAELPLRVVSGSWGRSGRTAGNVGSRIGEIAPVAGIYFYIEEITPFHRGQRDIATSFNSKRATAPQVLRSPTGIAAHNRNYRILPLFKAVAEAREMSSHEGSRTVKILIVLDNIALKERISLVFSCT